ncbi:receptor-interacting serine/threonine-protein kinase 3-like isoform X2 [Kryptolebias marmoratus]|uniref:receptor-interacting serine/threonine-protein kinase 3-like isoform X2 n=1 Tax=Kryptolebias marmoratus TaxID=37003 RepID=UPI0007F8A55C|nr:receptor-interacting serine/threonine-protein kinase 3-like isoform X2 [Kryptolebias marmoratus]
MAQASSVVIRDTDLEEWNYIGSGGFGDIYKACHKTWGLDVAIKLPLQSRRAEEKALVNEANNMKILEFDFVLRIYGIYDGTPPRKGISSQRGIVMEYMRRGSIETLQKNLAGPPPLPLAFRLAYQVALGINFLHLKNVLHQDLKPSNVLLTDELNAKLADFGLSRVTTSVLKTSDKTEGDFGGTLKYMPPEALKNVSYEPARSFDIYSYGILLWSIFTGQEPYEGKNDSLVKLRIPEGDRPEVKLEGMEELVTLMTKCWDKNPENRPKSEEIMKETKKMFSKHQRKVTAAVFEVLSKLDSPTSDQFPLTGGADSNTSHPSENAKSNDIVDHPRFTTQDLGVAVGTPSGEAASPSQDQHRDTQVKQPDTFTPKMSDSVCTKNLTKTEKATFVDDKRAELIQRTSQIMAIVEELGKRVHPEAYSTIKAKKVPQEKMRQIYETTLRSGESAKAAFYDALKKHEPDLMEDLGA